MAHLPPDTGPGADPLDPAETADLARILAEWEGATVAELPLDHLDLHATNDDLALSGRPLATVAAVTFLAFFAPPGLTALPLWLWGALVLRDLVLGAGFLVIWRKHRTVAVEHRWHGRLSTLLLFVNVVAACAGAPAWTVLGGSAVVVVLVVPGTVDYVREGVRQLSQPT